jgi:electron transfer flavoprotein beta subunit
LKIIVCIKQVPDPEHFYKLTVDSQTGSINRGELPAITNPHDRHALEEALRKKEQYGGMVSVLTMGPSKARECLEDALAMGADRGAILSDHSFGGTDTLSTARILSYGIRQLGDFDLIICGNETVDGATGQVPAQLAQFLNIPHVTHAIKVELTDEKTACVRRSIEGGYLTIEVKLPALVSVQKKINTCRLPTVMGIMEAADKEIIDLGPVVCDAFESDKVDACESPTRVVEVFESPLKKNVEMLEGEPEKVARQFILRLHELEAL